MTVSRGVFEDVRPGMAGALGALVDLPLPSRGDDGFAVLRVILPAGARVPLHSQADRASIVVLEGEIEAWFGDGWRVVGQGGMVDSRAGTRHALRNAGDVDAALVVATTQRMRQFLADVAVPSADPFGVPLGYLRERARAYGYWIGGRDEQAAIGFRFDRPARRTNPDSLGSRGCPDRKDGSSSRGRTSVRLAEDGPERGTRTLLIPDRFGGLEVDLSEIVWVEAARDYALIHTLTRKHIMRSTMSRLERRLAGFAIRIHRSTLVAPDHVVRWRLPVKGVYGLVLSDGAEVAVGASYLTVVRRELRAIDR